MTKIMLVEDDKSLREIYGVRLIAEGYDVKSADDGEEGLAMVIKEKPELIISDVMMPKISGFDMLDILRATPETKDVKVIMMTALSSEDQKTRGEALGADKYLVKSQVGIEDVVRAVHDVLGDAPTTTKADASKSFGPPVSATAPESTDKPEPMPSPTETPVAEPVATPVAPAPAEPAQSSAMPQPTAPFSSPAPASLAESAVKPAEPIVATEPTMTTPAVPTEEPTLNPAPAAEPIVATEPVAPSEPISTPTPESVPTPTPSGAPATETVESEVKSIESDIPLNLQMPVDAKPILEPVGLDIAPLETEAMTTTEENPTTSEPASTQQPVMASTEAPQNPAMPQQPIAQAQKTPEERPIKINISKIPVEDQPTKVTNPVPVPAPKNTNPVEAPISQPVAPSQSTTPTASPSQQSIADQIARELGNAPKA